MYPPTYPKDPIVEAMLEVRFTPTSPWNDELAAKISAAFRAEYPAEPLKRNQFAFHARVEGDSISTGAQLGARHLLHRTVDEKSLVGVAPGILSIHVLAPYPGWISFFPRIQRALATYQQVAAPLGVQQVTLRYIDRIVLPSDPNIPLNSLLPILPNRPASMPQSLDGFHVVTQARDEAENLTAVLTLASVADPSEREAVLYDLSIARLFPEPVGLDALAPHIEMLHKRQREIFEDSISDETRRLFQ